MNEIPHDYYISPMDWSCQNVIAIAGSDGIVRLVNPKTLEVTPIDKTKLDGVECVKYNPEGTSMVVGSATRPILLYDVSTGKITRSYRFGDQSANAITVADWRDNTIIGGTRSGRIVIIDTREATAHSYQLHIDEVCAVRMSPNMQYLATSGNDSLVKIWDMRSIGESTDEILAYDEHDAACRALAWSPYNDDIIITGGGTSDKKIRMWNTVTGETIRSVDTGSQVCNIYWNEGHNEIVSTHGYSQNHIALWKASDFKPIGSIHTHKERVLYMAVSPDGSTVATAGEDSCMQMWKFWPQKNMSMSQSLLVLR